MRRPLLATVGCAALLAFGFAGCGDDSSGSTEPTGPTDLTVTAKSLRFDADSYSVKAGNDVIEYVNADGQLHTLVIEDVKDFKLKTPGRGDTDRAEVDLSPGTYTIYCDVDSHRAAGMEATLKVT